MELEEIKQLETDMASVAEKDAALFVAMKGDEVTLTAVGKPRPLTQLKQWIWKHMGGRN